MKREFLFSVIASLLPLLYIFIWLVKNSQLPGADGATYLLMSGVHMHHFIDDGFWRGLLNCYLERGSRSIIFPVFITPFLLLSHGNLYFAFSSIAILSVLLSVVYIYFLFRLSLDRGSSLIASSVIGLLPIFLAPISCFFAEAMMFPCIMGALYHLIKSNYLKNRGHTWGFIILLSLAFMLRPVETIFNFFFVFLAFLYLGWTNGIFNLKSILLTVSISSTTFLLFLLSCLFISIGLYEFHIHENNFHQLINLSILYFLIPTFLFTMLMWFIVNYTKEKSFNKKLISSIILISIIVLFWFTPYALDTFEWIYQTSVGSVAGGGPLIRSHPFWDEILSFFIREGTVVTSVIILMALFNLRKDIPVVCYYLLLTLPIPLLEILFTIQDTIRKVSIAFPAFFMAMLIIALQPGKWLVWRRVIILSLLVFQCATLFLFMFCKPYSGMTHIKYITSTVLYDVIGDYVPPVTIKPNPNIVIEDFLFKYKQQYHLQSVAMIGDNVADSFLLTTVMEMRRFNKKDTIYIGIPAIPTYTSASAMQLSKEFDSFLLSDKKEHMKHSAAANFYKQRFLAEHEPPTKLRYEFLYYFAMDQLPKLGWNLGPCITVKSVDNQDYFTCLLLPLREKR